MSDRILFPDQYLSTLFENAPSREEEDFVWEQDNWPVWIKPQKWWRNIADNSSTFINLTTDKPLNVFQAYIMAFIHHLWKDYSYQHQEYKNSYVTAAIIGDYRNVSYSRETLYEMLLEDKEDKFADDFDVIFWAHRGRQAVVRALDDDDNVTDAARWFFQTSDYWINFNNILTNEERFDRASTDKFFREMSDAQGRGIDYGTIHPDHSITVRPNYKGEDNHPFPNAIQLVFNSLNLKDRSDFRKRYHDKMTTLVMSDFFEGINSSSYLYRSWLKPGWFDTLRYDDSTKANVFAMFNTAGLIDVNDYNHEVSIRYETVAIPCIFSIIDAIDIDPEDNDDDPFRRILSAFDVDSPFELLETCIGIIGDDNDVYQKKDIQNLLETVLNSLDAKHKSDTGDSE